MLQFKFILLNSFLVFFYVSFLVSLSGAVRTDINCPPGRIEDCIDSNTENSELGVNLEAGDYTLSQINSDFEELAIIGPSSEKPRTPEQRNNQDESFVTLKGTLDLDNIDNFQLKYSTLQISDDIDVSQGKGLFNRPLKITMEGVILEDVKGMIFLYQPAENITGSRDSLFTSNYAYYNFVNSEPWVYEDILDGVSQNNLFTSQSSVFRFVDSTPYLGGLDYMQYSFGDLYLDTKNWSIPTSFGSFTWYSSNFYCSDRTELVELSYEDGSGRLSGARIECPKTTWTMGKTEVKTTFLNVSNFNGEDVVSFRDNEMWSSGQIHLSKSSKSQFEYDEPFRAVDFDSSQDTFQFPDYAFSGEGYLSLDQSSLEPENEDWSLFTPEEVPAKISLTNVRIPAFNDLNASVMDAQDSCLTSSNGSRFTLAYDAEEQSLENFFWIPPPGVELSESFIYELDNYTENHCSCVNCIRLDNILKDFNGTECESISFQNACTPRNDSCTVYFSAIDMDKIEIPQMLSGQSILFPGESSIEWESEYCPETKLNAALINMEEETIKELSPSESPLFFDLEENDGNEILMIKLYNEQQTLGFSSSFEIAQMKLNELLGMNKGNWIKPGAEIEILYQSVPDQVSAFLERIDPEDTSIVMENITLSLNETGKIQIPYNITNQAKYQIRLINDLGLEDLSEIFTIYDEVWAIFDFFTYSCLSYKHTEAIPVGVCSPMGYRAECAPHEESEPVSLVSCRNDTVDLEYHRDTCYESDFHPTGHMKVFCSQGNPEPMSETRQSRETQAAAYGYPQGSDCNADPIYFVSTFEGRIGECWSSSYLTTEMKSSLELECQRSTSGPVLQLGILPWDETCSRCPYSKLVSGCTSHPGLPFQFTGYCDDGQSYSDESSSSSTSQIPYQDLKIANETEWVVFDVYSDSTCQVYEYTDAFPVGECNPLGTRMSCYYEGENYYPYIDRCYFTGGSMIRGGECIALTNYYPVPVYVKAGCASDHPDPIHETYPLNGTYPRIYGYGSSSCDTDPIYFTTTKHSSDCRDTSYLSPFVTSSLLSCNEDNEAVVDTSILSKDCTTCGEEKPLSQCTNVSGLMRLYLKGNCTFQNSQ
eukprot:gb/GECH01012628.1/.p1 GENE.gb/GECH01012628.1/~~gb/GECH01012628.1/.p1  ORF type:complete len:1102 (+),score=150.04 gb/GECH01012628.1/:1-3306(+)